MNISGIVVHASPDKVDRVRVQLEKILGVEVHAASAEGKMVVTIEKPSDRETADIFEEIGRIPGILSTAMVYHHFEPDAEAAA
ncbi:MAG: glutamate synthase [Hydrogenophilales bacterium CG_4_9_14_3_um_filter_59_35]|nr:MAG: glutamate synthase [Hydrogenophilales bacterium CG18_big_fil_WC_8_21_14_2_50_58_12]PIX98591.1 MAG: glutamate synthase [Hydrogenophilales bacterium CG_4_10_14_3_um_filter_58_23]PJB04760.1 MAG: glutamate synthase [Hydrogenophilales bacterium CG_4_9_14_3_um_filter_59_35]